MHTEGVHRSGETDSVELEFSLTPVLLLPPLCFTVEGEEKVYLQSLYFGLLVSYVSKLLKVKDYCSKEVHVHRSQPWLPSPAVTGRVLGVRGQRTPLLLRTGTDTGSPRGSGDVPSPVRVLVPQRWSSSESVTTTLSTHQWSKDYPASEPTGADSDREST